MANDAEIKITQEAASKLYFRFFPEWKEMEGALTRMGILRLLEAMRIDFKFVLITEDLTEFLDALIRKDKEDLFVGAFVLLHNHTHHCLRVFGVTGDVGDVLDPDQLNSKRGFVRWADLKSRNPEFLLV